MRKSVLVLLMLFASLVSPARAESPEPELSSDRLILHTNVGDIVLGFFPQVAPKHVAQILQMARAGVYDGMLFFRVEKGFVAQIENYDTRKIPLTPEQLATVAKIPAEFGAIRHQRGLLSMARYDDPNSAEASFSIMLGDAPHMDGQYTIFGRVVDGMDVVDAIENVPVTAGTPTTEILIQQAEIVNAAQVGDMHLRGATPTSVPGGQVNFIFEIFAGVMFFLTVVTPILKSLLSAAPRSVKT